MSDGQFSSKPMRSGKKTDITTTAAIGAGAFSANEARDFAQSPSVRREIDALLEEPFLDVARLDCAPFPRGTPDHARDLGQPIASATLVQEYLIGLVFLRFWGWVFMAFGLFFVFGAASVVIGGIGRENPRGGDNLIGGAIALGIGLTIGGVGAWFGIFRGRVVTERCWFCPHGMVWMTEGVFEWWPWEDIPEVYAKPHANRPAVGIRFDGPISWISFSDTQPSRVVVDYVENRASAAWLPAALQLLAEGKTIRFGDLRLHRLSLHSVQDSLLWAQIADLKVRDGELVLCGADGRAELAIWLDEIPLPSLFTTLARALIAQTREQKA